ncbi:LamG domain-containing protein [Akkermansiaceae bacterium]|nr:LamG domain-containing protein [Akkermansiaceae bacterium]
MKSYLNTVTKLMGVSALTLALGGAAHAAVWIGAADSGEYSTPTNWDDGLAPAVNSIQDINGAFTVDRSVDSVSGRTFVGGGATLNITSGEHSDSRSGNAVRNFIGNDSAGAVNLSGGSWNVGHMVLVGSGAGNGTFIQSSGDFSASRAGNSFMLIAGGSSLEIGVGSATGLYQISGGAMTTRVGVGVGMGGTFEVIGTGATTIGIGSSGSLDGSWNQAAGGILRLGLDDTGITPILIDVTTGTGSGGGNVIFGDGSILDPYDVGGAVTGVWTTVMTWEGALTDNGLTLSAAAVEEGWEKQVEGSNLQVRLNSTVLGNPVVNSFEASERTIFLGETSTLLWDVSDATSLEIDQGIGAVINPAGSVDVTPTETTNYTMTATNTNGSTERQVLITVIPDPIVNAFTVDPKLIYVGETVTLTWDIENSTSIEIDQGIGAVAGPSGSVEVTPTESATYTLTATKENGVNGIGTSSAIVSVTVLPIPPPRELLLHWDFDEASGTTASDSAGANDGTFLETGGVITRVEGVLGGALTFPNANDTAVIALTQLVDAYPFAMSGWVKTVASANDTFAVLGTNTNGEYHSLLVQGGVAKGLVRAGNFFYSNGPAVNDDTWHHIITVFEHVGSASIYVDGVFAQQRTAQAGEFVLPDRFGVGALARTDTSVVDSFDGSVDDVSFWKGIITANEAAALAGGATGLALNASDIASLLDGFDTQSSAFAGGVSWNYAPGLVGAVGETGGTIAGGDGFIILDDDGNGMFASGVGLAVTGLVADAGGRTLTWNSIPGSTYTIEYSENLQNWFEVDDGALADSVSTSFYDPDAARLVAPFGYYRVIQNTSAN